LFIRPETVSTHLKDYTNSNKLKPNNGGSQGLLNEVQASKLNEHLEMQTYTKVKSICAHVKEVYNIKYTVSGMHKWLVQHEFSYKKPKATPARANPEEQAKFVETYTHLLSQVKEDEPIVFLDAVHPTMATKISGGWIKVGKDKLIKVSAARTRVNIIGALELKSMKVISASYDTVNGINIGKHFALIRDSYPNAGKIHMILDRGGYNISAQAKEDAKKHGIELHYLPPYSPNLNPIERLWKVMNEKSRNNIFFKTPGEFRVAINNFFILTWPQICESMRTRINDNFQRINQTSSG